MKLQEIVTAFSDFTATLRNAVPLYRIKPHVAAKYGLDFAPNCVSLITQH